MHKLSAYWDRNRDPTGNKVNMALQCTSSTKQPLITDRLRRHEPSSPAGADGCMEASMEPAAAAMVSAVTISVGGFQTGGSGSQPSKSIRHQERGTAT
jgi:hypothetical protein